MSTEAQPRSDGSAELDARRVRINRNGPARYRWRCPNGHVSWDRTNQHVWCGACARAAEQGENVDPEHWEIQDAKTGESIAWGRIEVATE